MPEAHSSAQAAGVVVGMLFYAVFILGTVIGMWAAFAKAFGRDIGTAIGLFLLGFIFWPMLGFGDAKYQGV